jgi:hypothetical protein
MKKLFLAIAIGCFIQSEAQQKLPIVFVHGFLASGDTWSTQYNRFLQNGYTQNELQVFDWNTINGKGNDSLLNIFIDSVLQLNNTTQVNLIGHSAGGGLGYRYCSNESFAKKIAHYTHIGSSKLNTPAANGTIPTQIIYSTDDKVAQKAGDTEGAVNVKLTGLDHYQVATSATTFEQLFQFFNQEKPKTIVAKEITTKNILVRNLFFATNQVLPNSKAIVQQYNPMKGNFIGTTQTYTANSQGWWGIKINKNTLGNYVISIQPNTTSRKVTYFFEGIKTDKLISLRAFSSDNMIGALLSQLPQDDLQPALCIFTANQAVVAGRDTLAINGIPLSGEKLTPANKTIIATFVYDDGDKKSSGTKHAALAAAPFMNGIDCFIDVQKEKLVRIYYNGRTIKIPLLASKESITVVVLE